MRLTSDSPKWQGSAASRASYGNKLKFSFDVKGKKKMKSYELDEMEENIEYYYDENVSIKAGYILEVDAEIKGSKDSDKDRIKIEVIKIGSKWYLSENMF
jgi:hypothetical protein